MIPKSVWATTLPSLASTFHSNLLLILVGILCFTPSLSYAAFGPDGIDSDLPEQAQCNTARAPAAGAISDTDKKSNGYDIEGTAPPGTTVAIVATQSKFACQAQVGADGKFSGCILGRVDGGSENLKDGDSLEVVVVNKCGKRSEAVTSDTKISFTESDAKALLKDGVFGCTTGRYAPGVAVFSAQQGVYVPVNDLAVTLNTGYLVYKFCVLDGIVARQREAATAGYVKNALTNLATGRGGRAKFSDSDNRYLAEEFGARTVKNFVNRVREVTPGQTATVITNNLVRNYVTAVQSPYKRLTCDIPEDVRKRCLDNNCSASELSQVLSSRTCNSFGQYMETLDLYQDTMSAAFEEEKRRIDRNDGYFDEVDENGFAVTPGSTVGAISNQFITSGFRQLEQADAVDQIISPLFSGLSSQILAGAKGLLGTIQNQGTKASYVNQLSSESSAGLRNSVGNTAASILNTSLVTEQGFVTAQTTIRDALKDGEAQLKEAERRCYELLIPKVQAFASAGGPCSEGTLVTNPDGTSSAPSCTAVTLKIATSTAFSDAALSSNIATPLIRVENDLTKARNALSLIARLVVDIQNTSSVTAQRNALERLDALIANNQLHTSYDLKIAQEEAKTIVASTKNTVESIIKAWAEGTMRQEGGMTKGWCNINDQGTIRTWFNQWKTS
jgi:hypothetical protein